MAPCVGGPDAFCVDDQYVVRAHPDVFNMSLGSSENARTWNVNINGKTYRVVAPDFEYYRRRLKLEIDGVSHMFRLQYQENHIRAFYSGIVITFEIYNLQEWSVAHFMLRDVKSTQENELRCPMPGLITALSVQEGVMVRKGQELLRMESMKMESSVASPRDGLIDKILIKPGQAVETDETLIIFRDA